MTTLTPVDLVRRIADVLLNAEGEYLAQVHNQVCSEQVAYLGDSVFEATPPSQQEVLEELGYSFRRTGHASWSWDAISDSAVCFRRRGCGSRLGRRSAASPRHFGPHFRELGCAGRSTAGHTDVQHLVARGKPHGEHLPRFLASTPAQGCSSKASSVPLGYTGYGVHPKLSREKPRPSGRGVNRAVENETLAGLC